MRRTSSSTENGNIRYWAEIMATLPDVQFDVFCNDVPNVEREPFRAPNARYIRKMVWKRPLKSQQPTWLNRWQGPLWPNAS